MYLHRAPGPGLSALGMFIIPSIQLRPVKEADCYPSMENGARPHSGFKKPATVPDLVSLAPDPRSGAYAGGGDGPAHLATRCPSSEQPPRGPQSLQDSGEHEKTMKPPNPSSQPLAPPTPLPPSCLQSPLAHLLRGTLPPGRACSVPAQLRPSQESSVPGDHTYLVLQA